MIMTWRARLATTSSMMGKTAARPRSMMLCPPILMTLACGRICTSGPPPVSACSASSVSERSMSALPSCVRSSSGKLHAFQEIAARHVALGAQIAELLLRPQLQLVEDLRLHAVGDDAPAEPGLGAPRLEGIDGRLLLGPFGAEAIFEAR